MGRTGIPLAVRFWNFVESTPADDCWNWTGSKTRQGYGKLSSYPGWSLAHRVSYGMHKGGIPIGVCVLHHCDNPKCVNPRHLFLGDNNTNVKDRVSKGRSARNAGEKNGAHKLTTDNVLAIKSDCRRYKKIADNFHVCVGVVTRIKNGTAWQHLEERGR